MLSKNESANKYKTQCTNYEKNAKFKCSSSFIEKIWYVYNTILFFVLLKNNKSLVFLLYLFLTERHRMTFLFRTIKYFVHNITS